MRVSTHRSISLWTAVMGLSSTLIAWVFLLLHHHTIWLALTVCCYTFCAVSFWESYHARKMMKRNMAQLEQAAEEFRRRSGHGI